jgi:hypothetical protein
MAIIQHFIVSSFRKSTRTLAGITATLFKETFPNSVEGNIMLVTIIVGTLTCAALLLGL